ncbi:molybdopterin-dependent oxidoreductase [Acidipila sp. EB88]|uniref:molybdopterin-containing oxidoreductase family protein n=1 Tax=Acidipila sp. EB88 TaxID=2305226 RepID=UPI000F5DF0DB|nr:molybdopterin-dependent oxidoreductase [Acidipila sp. EB88]RRA47927.1 molybdopterin oxidoreductase [Acidipila sp. EB88]
MATHTRRSVCSLDCPDSCGVLVTIDTETGEALRVAGDPEHPVTRGFLCGKVAKYLDHVYAPDRVLYPMRRRAGVPKGPLAPGAQNAAFERIGWDEALHAIATRLGAIARERGPEAVLPYSYAGTIGTLGYGSMDRRFFHRFGASQLKRTICATAGGEAFLSVYGRKLGTDTEHFHHARLVIAWGANIHNNNIHLWPQVEEARRNGAWLVVIDPYATRTAQLADQHLAIHPGTDTALALGLMHVILRDGLEDAAWCEQHTHGLAELRAHVRSYTPAMVEDATGIAANLVEELARAYATTKPAVIRLNYGVQRSENGGAAARAVCMLPALTGAWQHLGGGLQLSTSGAFSFDSQAVERPDLMYASPLGRAARTVNMAQLGDALCDLEKPAVHALFVYNSNPAVIAPEQRKVLRGLQRDDLFTVVHEQSFTDTCDYADYVLPATTFLEHVDMQGAYGHYYVQLSEQAIAPVGEARANVELFSALAQHMGYTESCFSDDAETLIAQALREDAAPEDTTPGSVLMRGITRATLRAHGGSERLHFPSEHAVAPEPFRPFSDGVFPTPSGKAEFFSEQLAAQGQDAMPTYHPPVELRTRQTPADAEGMLQFLPRKSGNFMNSTFANHAAHQKMQRETLDLLELHAEDAQVRGLAEGDLAEIRNERGALRLRVRISRRVQPGVASAGMAWSKLNPEGGKGVNQLTSQRLTDLGDGPTFYSTLVQVRRVQCACEAETGCVLCHVGALEAGVSLE